MDGTPSHFNPGPCGARRGAPMHGRRGFNLAEAAIVMVVVGIGICAILDLLAAGTAANAEAAEMSAAMNLANNVREISLDMRYLDPEQPTLWDTKEKGANGQPDVNLFDNLFDLDGCEFCPPLDCGRQRIPGYGNWKQKVKVETVLPGNLASPVANSVREPIARVTVTIERGGAKVYALSWVASKRRAN